MVHAVERLTRRRIMGSIQKWKKRFASANLQQARETEEKI
jgi:hypothetical protein